MIVFKGFMKLVKKNAGIALMYISIFFAVSMMISKNANTSTSDNFIASELLVTVIDRDQSPLSEALTAHLAETFTLVPMEDKENVLQDALFNRSTQYIIQIPENFQDDFQAGTQELITNKIPDSTNGMYADQTVDAFLNDVRALNLAGYSLEEACQETKKAASVTADISLISEDTSVFSTYSFIFVYMPYIILSLCCYIPPIVLLAFKKKDLRTRILSAPISSRSQSLQLVLGFALLGLAFWVLNLLFVLIMDGKAFLQSPNVSYYLGNSLCLTLVSLAIAFLISTFLKRDDALSAITNVISLGMCFLCGVFVPLTLLGDSVKKFAQFLPLYWYENNVSLLNKVAITTKSQTLQLYQGFGIQLLFCVALVSIALMVNKRMNVIDK
ncbi:ABC-2 type transport system permease protein [Lachnospiraceae bacterium PFB1-21]